jgi:peptidyl-tRNA hydrolase, PTH2 family
MDLKENAPKQVIIIRKDLNMRKGKMIAQGAHASIAVIFNYMSPSYSKPFVGKGMERQPFHFDIDLPDDETGKKMKEWMTGIFKKIVVGAENLQEMVDAYQEAKRQGIPCSIIEDAGLTEFGGNVTITAVAIGPDDPEKIDKITGKFKLL